MRRQVQYSGDSEAVGYDSKVIIVTHEYENNEVVTYHSGELWTLGAVAIQ